MIVIIERVTLAVDALATDPTTLGGTEDRLLTAAAQVFAEKGYDGAGVAEIARRAGLTTGAIYSRFTGKADLLAATIRRHGGDQLDILFDEETGPTDAAVLVQLVGEHLVTREEGPGRALLLEAFVAARRDPEVAGFLRRHLDARRTRFAAVIDEAKRSGQVDPAVDTHAVVHLAHAVGLGFLLYDAIGTQNPDAGAWSDLVGRLITSVVDTSNPDHPDR